MTRDHPTDHPSEADESPLRRWSRRKHAARERPAADEHAPDADTEQRTNTAAEAEPEAERAAERAGEVTDADLPPVESLTPDSDFSDFMSPKVSESLRRTALRKLFGLPQFNVRDGLDDYDDDYTQFSSLGDTVTADMRYHTERRAAAARERQEAADEQAAQAQAPETTAASDDEQAAATPTAPPDDQSEAEDDPDGVA